MTRDASMSAPIAWLYRHRGLTAAPLALYLVWAARPTVSSYLVGLLLLLVFEMLRIRALRYAGGHTRGRTLRAPHLATGGPYARMRHPLYLGNAGVCAGLLVASRAGWPWFPLLFAALFGVQYLLFAAREERFLSDTHGEAWADYAARVPALGWGRGDADASHSVLTTIEAVRVEFPTLRTILALLILIALRPLAR